MAAFDIVGTAVITEAGVLMCGDFERSARGWRWDQLLAHAWNQI
ncbi:hypothetical protein ACFY1S_26200 [Micromonospora sp. NPDC000663]